MAIITCKFLKHFRGACPQTPQEPFLFLDLLQSNSAGKTTLKNVKFWCPPLKNSESALTWNIFKGLIYAFLDLTVERLCIYYLVKIQPTFLKLHPPTKIFWIRSCKEVPKYISASGPRFSLNGPAHYLFA